MHLNQLIKIYMRSYRQKELLLHILSQLIFLLFNICSSVKHLLDLVAGRACEFVFSQQQDWAEAGVKQKIVLSFKKSVSIIILYFFFF